MGIVEPALKQTADKASGHYQYIFLTLNRVQLALLTATALLSGWNPPDAGPQKAVAIGVLVLMFAALLVGVALKNGRYDDKWFRCRALAENIKSSTWYFAMSPAHDRANKEAEYLEQVREVRERFPLSKELADFRVDGPAVTPWMEETQAKSLEEKAAIFLAERLEDQIKWYDSKAKFNARRESQWQWAFFGVEAVAVVCAAIQVMELWQFNVVGGIAATGSAVIAWTQTKRHSDLANSYAVAADDLRFIRDRRGHPQSDDDLRELVNETEIAVSREHSIWVDRRLS